MRMRMSIMAPVVVLLALLAAAAQPAAARDAEMPAALQAEPMEGGVEWALLSGRVAVPRRGEACARLVWCFADSANYCYATVAGRQSADPLYPSQATVQAGRVCQGVDSECLSGSFLLYGDTLSIKVLYDGYAAMLYCGSRRQEPMGVVPFDAACGGGVGLAAEAPAACVRLNALSEHAGSLGMCSDADSPAELEARLASGSDPMEGVWEYLDRDLAQGKATLGDRYRLATVAQADGSWQLVLLGGADDAGQAPMMVKGVLAPTEYAANFDLVWLDANGRVLADDNYATLSADGSILTLCFPVHRATLRFSRVR